MTGAGWTGRDLILDVGPVAHGGHCVARYEGRVVFVRHALPSERVRALVTEDAGGSYCRADAVSVLTASADRVEPPCPYAGPGRCGGCDWQHADGAAQRALKGAVVREQLARLGGRPDVAITVEALPGGLLGWRSRVRFAVDPAGRVGMHRHRSAELELVQHCPLGTADVNAVGVPQHQWPGVDAVEVVASSGGDRALVVTAGAPAAVAVPALHTAGLSVLQRRPGDGPTRRSGHRAVREQAAGRVFRVGAGGFWQVHVGAAEALVTAVLEALAPRPGESAVDLYAGVGLFGAAIGDRLGAGGRVTLIESDPAAARDAVFNLRDQTAQVTVRVGRVDRALRKHPPVDLVVLDPPRSGAKATVVRQIAALTPRAVAYVACDPAALARDVATFAAHGYRLASVRAFDLFPMTHHIECVA
ncbi:MAG: TRAM domain-containing protein, partial [Actinomycetota bacterium]|nr:TRAM domain-containing protein [Actinomycetota bacterium]